MILGSACVGHVCVRVCAGVLYCVCVTVKRATCTLGESPPPPHTHTHHRTHPIVLSLCLRSLHKNAVWFAHPTPALAPPLISPLHQYKSPSPHPPAYRLSEFTQLFVSSCCVAMDFYPPAANICRDVERLVG